MDEIKVFQVRVLIFFCHVFPMLWNTLAGICGKQGFERDSNSYCGPLKFRGIGHIMARCFPRGQHSLHLVFTA